LSLVSGLGTAVGIGFADATIWEFTHTGSVREQDIFLTVCKFNCFDSTLFNSLDSAIRENAFLFSIGKNALNRSVREAKKEFKTKDILLT
jgi:hypothetical protein